MVSCATLPLVLPRVTAFIDEVEAASTWRGGVFPGDQPAGGHVALVHHTATRRSHHRLKRELTRRT